jgi:hypothetical protein
MCLLSQLMKEAMLILILFRRMRKPVALFAVRPAVVRSTRKRLTMVVLGIVALVVKV